ncbi:hypothetical protein SLS60_005423 [Paraconiothyrium brasiliense]|uniref:Uncharacterized protein n=1 Tax=Paraconiothyrium brasiliense TaxID=300254 RepID=A0ABR3RHK7_9PLEO
MVPWIALTRCDDDESIWGACSQEGNPSTLQPGSFCSCTEVAKFTPTAFSDNSVLALFASLPTATGESIKFETGHVPTGNPTSDSSPAETGSASAGASGTSGGGSTASQTGGGSATQGGSGSGSGSSATASRTGTGSASSGTSSSSTGSNNGGSNNGGSNNGGSTNGSSSDGSSGLASGAKIGIGVGVAVAVLLLIAIIAAVLLRRRKRRRSQAAAAGTEVEKGDKKDATLANGAAAGRTSNLSAADPRISDVTGGTDGTNNMSEADGKPLSGADKPGVSELDSGAVMEVSGQTAHPWDRGAELDGRPLRKPSSPKELPGSLAAESPPGWVVR